MATTKAPTAAVKTLAGISNLVKLLPTTTLQAFLTLNPSFTNHGECLRSNKLLTALLIIICSITCAIFSITDSVMHKGKLYIGIATLNGLYIFNFDDEDTDDVRNWFKHHCQKKYKLKISDGVHVILTVIVFLSLSFSNGYVQSCFFTGADENGRVWLTYLPSGFSILAGMVFLLMPKARKGVGYSPDTETPEDEANSSPTKLRALNNVNSRSKTCNHCHHHIEGDSAIEENEFLGSEYKYIRA